MALSHHVDTGNWIQALWKKQSVFLSTEPSLQTCWLLLKKYFVHFFKLIFSIYFDHVSPFPVSLRSSPFPYPLNFVFVFSLSPQNKTKNKQTPIRKKMPKWNKPDKTIELVSVGHSTPISGHGTLSLQFPPLVLLFCLLGGSCLRSLSHSFTFEGWFSAHIVLDGFYFFVKNISLLKVFTVLFAWCAEKLTVILFTVPPY